MKDISKSLETLALIRAALKEDLGGHGDLTTNFFLPKDARFRGRIVSRENGVVCGTGLAARVFRTLDPKCKITIAVKDGRKVRPGQAILTIAGDRTVLTAERTSLNFLGHLSGIATLTAAFAALTHGTKARIYDTRKTLPGWRRLAKYAVLCGGGVNHRMDLSEVVMLKDNHWSSMGALENGIASLRKRHPRVPIEVEAEDLLQVKRALFLNADIILLDNMKPKDIKDAIRLIRRKDPKVTIEVSGGVSLKNVRSLAKLGPDRISVGRITHSAPALNISLEIG